MQTACCYCHKPFDYPPEQGGTVVMCPHCFGQLQLPPSVSRKGTEASNFPSFVSAPEERRSDKAKGLKDQSIWVKCFWALGILNAVVSAIGFLIGVFYDNYDVRVSGWYLFVICLIGSVQAFFVAFLVEVFLDIRSLLRELVEKKGS